MLPIGQGSERSIWDLSRDFFTDFYIAFWPWTCSWLLKVYSMIQVAIGKVQNGSGLYRWWWRNSFILGSLDPAFDLDNGWPWHLSRFRMVQAMIGQGSDHDCSSFTRFSLVKVQNGQGSEWSTSEWLRSIMVQKSKGPDWERSRRIRIRMVYVLTGSWSTLLKILLGYWSRLRMNQSSRPWLVL
jgi:hypothetical protein